MKRVCSISAVFLIIAYVIFRENAPSSSVYVIPGDHSENFVKEFSRRFDDKDEVWLVLGNRGITNYYVERFSKNWIFWADHLSADNIGISGNFLNLENWSHVSKILPRKVKYIAADFNELVDYPGRNDIIVSAKEVLDIDGIFCIEDVYNNKEGMFEHFTDKDFQMLSQDFDIKYAVYDGYVSALPYTSSQSSSKRLDMYKGLETMILRLSSTKAEEKKKLLPRITKALYDRSSSIDKKLTEKLVRNIVTSPRLVRLIQKYEDLIEKSSKITVDIEKEEKEITALKSEISRFEKVGNIVDSASKKLSTFTFFNNLSTVFGKGSSKDIQEKLKEDQNKLSSHEENLKELKTQLNFIKKDSDAIRDEILKCNEESYEKFERDEYLKPYLKYKKIELDDIIKNSKRASKEFWREYGSSDGGAISEIEFLSKELEKSWSPDVLIQNEVPIEHIKSKDRQRMADKSRIVIMFIKKRDQQSDVN